MARLTDQPCMVVARKQSRAIIEKVLKTVGITTILIPESFRDVTELSLQDMPHFYILEADLQDSSMMLIVKKIKADPLLQSAQFFIIKKFTKEEVLELVKLKVSGMMQPPLNPAALQKKIKDSMVLLKNLSPYSVDPLCLPGAKSVSVKIPGKIVTVDGNFFCVESGVVIPSGRQITLRPEDTDKAPVRLTSAGTGEPDASRPAVRSLLFSFDSASGKGREWLLNLKKADASQSSSEREVLLYESNPQRAMQFKQMLQFYDIEAHTVPNFEKLRMVHQGRKSHFRVVYLCEPALHASGISWEKYAASLKGQECPIQIIATTSRSPAKKPGVIWMQMPFSLEPLVERFEAAFSQAKGSSGAAAAEAMRVEEVPCNMTFFGDLISVDEQGAIIDLPNELPPNSRINLTHPALSLIGLTKNIRVVASKAMDAAGARYRTRLSRQEGNESRGLYWKPVLEKLKPVMTEPPPKKTTKTAAASAKKSA